MIRVAITTDSGSDGEAAIYIQQREAGRHYKMEWQCPECSGGMLTETYEREDLHYIPCDYCGEGVYTDLIDYSLPRNMLTALDQTHLGPSFAPVYRDVVAGYCFRCETCQGNVYPLNLEADEYYCDCREWWRHVKEADLPRYRAWLGALEHEMSCPPPNEWLEAQVSHFFRAVTYTPAPIDWRKAGF